MKKFKIKTWKDTSRVRVIRPHLAGQEHLKMLEVVFMIKGVHQLQRIVSKNSCKRFVDLLETGIGTTKRRHLKKKFKINACKNLARARAIKLHLAGLES
jgi:hypothetical protein